MNPDEPDDQSSIDDYEMVFTPRLEALASRNISLEAFETALIFALEGRQALGDRPDDDDDVISSLEEMELVIDGQTYQVEDLADLEVKENPDVEP